MSDDHRITVHLAELMVRKKLTGQELAEKVGIHPNNISKLKNGDVSFVRLSTLSALCRVLECQPGDLLTYEK